MTETETRILRAHVAGTTFAYKDATSDVIRAKGKRLEVRREPGNEHDPNAVALLLNGRRVGYLPRAVAAEVAPLLDRGRHTVEVRRPSTIDTRVNVTVEEKDPLA